MRKLASPALLTGVYTFLAGITWVEGDVGQGLAGRVALPDMFGLLILVVAGLQASFGAGGRIPVDRTYRAYLPLLFAFTLSASLALQPTKAAFEVVVHFFIFTVSVALYGLLTRHEEGCLARVFQGVLYASASIALIGLLHFFFLPALFAGSHGGLSGTFRNTGQAGSYFGVMLAILFPAYLCGFIHRSWRNSILLGLIFVALFFTFKRAAIAGVFFGFAVLLARLLLVGSRREKLIAIALLLGCLPAYLGLSVILGYAVDAVPGVSYRFGRKMSLDAVDEFAGGFFMENFRAAVAALENRPLIGIGLNNAAGYITDELEIHGSYFAVIAYSGLIGAVCYLGFLSRFVWTTWRQSRSMDIYSKYLHYFWPFFVGLMGSWIYTYPLRKREFWIMFAVASAVVAFARKRRRSRRMITGDAQAYFSKSTGAG